jgi:hypothetical protein
MSNDFTEAIIRQVRAIYPHASEQEIHADLAEIVSAAGAKAHTQYPEDPQKRERYIAKATSAAICEALGDIKRFSAVH